MVFKDKSKAEGQVMDNDANKDLKDTQQEMMIELKLKTSKFLKKLKEQSRNTKVEMW